MSDSADSIKKAATAYERFLNVIHTLRAPGGCPWDREQTPASMRADLIEETFEAVDAISADDGEHAKEELGDVLLNDTMISYMYEQRGDFTIADEINELADKLIRRHPHVFKDSEGQSQVQEKADDAEKVLAQWDRIKENVEGRKNKSILDDVPESFPPLLRAYKLQKKSAKKGFDWPDVLGVEDKIFEEWNEVQTAKTDLEKLKISNPGQHPLEESSCPKLDKAQLALEEELGDLFFVLVNYCRHLGVNPENALARANKKFYDRFTYVESEMEKEGRIMNKENAKANFDEMNRLWNEAKLR